MHGKSAWQGGMHGREVCMVGGTCMVGGMCGRQVCMARGHAWQGGTHGKGDFMAVGGHAWQEGHAWQGGRMHGKGVVCVAGETATAVDGTPPTGGHSCLHVYLAFSSSIVTIQWRIYILDSYPLLV